MSAGRPAILTRAIVWLTALVIMRVTLGIVLGYHDYLPPNFRSDFLLGREAYFFGAYQWAFYAHLATGPVTLLLGLALMNGRLREWSPRVHRSLGKLQVGLVTLVLAPSGAWMAWYASPGVVTRVGFFLLAAATGATAALGWRSAVRREFAAHRRWMTRCFLLLCSAVVLRVIGGLTVVAGSEADWVYPVAAWASWLGPLAIFKGIEACRKRRTHRNIGDDYSSYSRIALSSAETEMSARRLGASMPSDSIWTCPLANTASVPPA